MDRRKKVHDDDDGRTIADMSGVNRQPLFVPRGLRDASRKPQRQEPEDPQREERPWEKQEELLSREERRWYILGALKAALLIALAFIVGLGLAILVMVLAWRGS